jgi:membrane associated rhomboid family serine protease
MVTSSGGLPERAAKVSSRSDDSEPPFDPTSWGGALIVMVAFAAVLWVVQIANAVDNHGLDRFGLRPREVSGLWGVLTTPFLHASAWQLLSSTGPFVLIGWVILLSGVRTWLIVTGFVAVVGGLATWLIAPSGLILGCSGLIFGWMGYLLARAYFSRRIAWIVVAVLVAFFFSGLFAGLLPSINSKSSWQAHVCSFVAGVLAGWLLHPRGGRANKRAAVARDAPTGP